jgi:hypothetical protein
MKTTKKATKKKVTKKKTAKNKLMKVSIYPKKDGCNVQLFYKNFSLNELFAIYEALQIEITEHLEEKLTL